MSASRISELTAGRTWFRTLVTGSRTWADKAAVYGQLDDLLREHRMLTVVHGACPSGADAIAAEWVVRAFRTSELGIVDSEPHPADWRRHGRAAGHIRNSEMVKAGAGVCLAFVMPCDKPGCQRLAERHGSHGTEQCALLAEHAGIEVRRFAPR